MKETFSGIKYNYGEMSPYKKKISDLINDTINKLYPNPKERSNSSNYLPRLAYRPPFLTRSYEFNSPADQLGAYFVDFDRLNSEANEGHSRIKLAIDKIRAPHAAYTNNLLLDLAKEISEYDDIAEPLNHYYKVVMRNLKNETLKLYGKVVEDFRRLLTVAALVKENFERYPELSNKCKKSILLFVKCSF